MIHTAHVHHRIHKYQMKSLYRTMQEASESENEAEIHGFASR